MKLIYESRRPRFFILKDDMQWIIASKKVIDRSTLRMSREAVSPQTVLYRYTGLTYHPNLQNLLDELAEYHFRKFAKKIEKIEKLGDAVLKTYELIDKVSKELK